MRTCVICGEEFAPKYPRRKTLTCSIVCRNKLQWQNVPERKPGGRRKPRETWICKQCGSEIVDKNPRTYCSQSCVGRAKWTGGIAVSKDGRARVRLRGGGRQLYSRCLMEGHLGRSLSYNEVVHHINGDPTDDRLENLEVLSRSAHTSGHSFAYWQVRKAAA